MCVMTCMSTRLVVRSVTHSLLGRFLLAGALIVPLFNLFGCGEGIVSAASAAPAPAAVAASGTSSSVTKATPVLGANLVRGEVALPASFMKSVKDYGATGDGFTDDTAALQAALSDGRSNLLGNYNGVPKGLYFPPGTYLIHDALLWNGCCVTLQGAGPGQSIIRLAASSSGFGSASSPKAMITTPAGNTSFRQNIWDLALSVAPGNPGAVGIDYVSNNNGSVRDVSIASDDGSGVAGVLLTRHYPGPLLIKNVSVDGFQYGFKTAAYEYGPTFEAVTLAHQTVAGIYNQQQTISLRDLHSSNSVPAIINNGGLVLVLDGVLQGGSSATQAIQNVGGLYARNVQSSGYGATLVDATPKIPVYVTGTLSEYVVGTPQTLRGGTSAVSLNLPISETPAYEDADPAAWAAFRPSWYGDTKGLQALLNSGASTIYFPFAAYFSYNEATVTVPDNVKRIVGFSSIVNGSISGTNGGGIRFIVSSNSTAPLVIEQFGYGVKVDHSGKRPVVVKSGRYSYASSESAGPVYLEDVTLAKQLVIQRGQQIWARQLDTEIPGTKIINYGTFWVMGLKTEQDGTVIDTQSTGSTEVLGNLIYPAQGVASNSILMKSATPAVSYIYSQSSYCASCGYPIQVLETQNGVNLELTADPTRRYVMSLFHGR